MRPPHLTMSGLLNLMTAAEHNMPQMMRDRVPERLVVTVAAQRAEVLVGMASMPVDRIVIGPAHIRSPLTVT